MEVEPFLINEHKVIQLFKRWIIKQLPANHVNTQQNTRTAKCEGMHCPSARPGKFVSVTQGQTVPLQNSHTKSSSSKKSVRPLGFKLGSDIYNLTALAGLRPVLAACFNTLYISKTNLLTEHQ